MAFTLREVARRAGVSHNAPYRHFRDKDDLMTAVAIEGYRELTEAMEKATRDRDGALDRLKRAGLGVHRVCPAPAGACRGDVRRALEGAETPGIEPGSKASIFCAGRPGGDAVESRELADGDPLEYAYLAWTMVHGVAKLAITGRLPYRTKAAILKFASFVIEASLPLRR